MTREDLDQVEVDFSSATFVTFFNSRNIGEEPTMVAIVFDEPQGQISYDLLLDTYNHSELTLVIARRSKYLDLSIVDKQTADSINIKSLKYRDHELTEFLKNEPTDTNILFVIASRDNNAPNGAYIIATREDYKPLVIGRYLTQ